MSRRKLFDREEALRTEAEAYLKKLRNKLSERDNDIARRAQQDRQEGAQRQAKIYLDLLEERAHFRDILRTRMAKKWRSQSKILLKRAEAYRKRLRRYINPQWLDETNTFPTPADFLGQGCGFKQPVEKIMVSLSGQTPVELLNKMQAAALVGNRHSGAEELSAMILDQPILVPVGLEEANAHSQNKSSPACGSDAPTYP